jgi:hypothetical protein
MEFIVIWLGLAAIVGVIGMKRGLGFGSWFLRSVLFSPLIAGIWVVAKKVDAKGPSTHSPERPGRKGFQMSQTKRSIVIAVLGFIAVGCRPTKESACDHMRKIRVTPGDPDGWLSACIAGFEKLEAKVTLNTDGETKDRARQNMLAGYRCVMDANDQAGLDECGTDLEQKMQALLKYR